MNLSLGTKLYRPFLVMHVVVGMVAGCGSSQPRIKRSQNVAAQTIPEVAAQNDASSKKGNETTQSASQLPEVQSKERQRLRLPALENSQANLDGAAVEKSPIPVITQSPSGSAGQSSPQPSATVVPVQSPAGQNVQPSLPPPVSGGMPVHTTAPMQTAQPVSSGPTLGATCNVVGLYDPATKLGCSPATLKWISVPGPVAGIQCNANGTAAGKFVSELSLGCLPGVSPTGYAWKVITQPEVGLQCNASGQAAGRQDAATGLVCKATPGSPTGYAWQLP